MPVVRRSQARSPSTAASCLAPNSKSCYFLTIKVRPALRSIAFPFSTFKNDATKVTSLQRRIARCQNLSGASEVIRQSLARRSPEPDRYRDSLDRAQGKCDLSIELEEDLSLLEGISKTSVPGVSKSRGLMMMMTVSDGSSTVMGIRRLEWVKDPEKR